MSQTRQRHSAVPSRAILRQAYRPQNLNASSSRLNCTQAERDSPFLATIWTPLSLIAHHHNWEESPMRKALLALATAATVGATAIAAPAPAEAGGFRGFGPGLAGGLIAGAVIGGIASSAYAYGPGYGYYGAPAPAYYGGYAPAYYGG